MQESARLSSFKGEENIVYPEGSVRARIELKRQILKSEGIKKLLVNEPYKQNCY